MLVEKWMLQAGNCLLKNGRRRTSIAFYNLEMVIRHKNRMKAEALLCRNVVGMLFNFIGNTVIHSCVKVELSYEIKNILSFLIYAIMDILNQALPDLA